MKSTALALALAAFAAAAGATPALPAPCAPLTRVASLDMTMLPDGRITVPVVIAGKSRPMLLDIEHQNSSVTPALAAELHLAPQDIPDNKIVVYAGNAVTQTVLVPSVAFGGASGGAMEFFLLESGKWRDENVAAPVSMDVFRAVDGTDPDIAGVIGADLLGNFDIELDFRSRKVNLFAQDHCQGAGVTWADSAAAVPFTVNKLGLIKIPAQLDGHDVILGLTTLGVHARMLLVDAERKLDVDDTSPSLVPIGWHGKEVSVYRDTFQSLTFGGIAIVHPQVDLIAEINRHDDDATIHARALDFIWLDGYEAGPPHKLGIGGSDVELGLDTLEKLHLFISFSEMTIYATAADAHK
ncbi:MAG: hypothetical protein ACREHE_14195 [Rhizomicrobium sp.]